MSYQLKYWARTPTSPPGSPKAVWCCWVILQKGPASWARALQTDESIPVTPFSLLPPPLLFSTRMGFVWNLKTLTSHNDGAINVGKQTRKTNLGTARIHFQSQLQFCFLSQGYQMRLQSQPLRILLMWWWWLMPLWRLQCRCCCHTWWTSCLIVGTLKKQLQVSWMQSRFDRSPILRMSWGALGWSLWHLILSHTEIKAGWLRHEWSIASMDRWVSQQRACALCPLLCPAKVALGNGWMLLAWLAHFDS